MMIRFLGGDHGDAIVQVLRRDGSCQERVRARSPALSLSSLRLQLHEYAPRGKPAAMKAMAVLLYAMGNMSFGMIGRILGVSDVSILRWVRAEAEALPEPAVPADVKVLVLDEMWHFVKKSQARFGSGAPMILSAGELWPGFWAAVMMQPAASSSPRRGRRGSSSSPTTGTDIIG